MSSVEEGRGRRTDLSEDLMDEILLKLPVRSLLRFKCVCKHWYNTILSPDFIAVHRMNNPRNNHTNEIPLSCYSCNYNAGPPATAAMSFRINKTLVDLTIPFKADKIEIVGCSNGVVCLSGSYRSNAYNELALWNPVTGQFWHIGCYDNDIDNDDDPFFSFYFDPIAKSFILVGVHFVPHDNDRKRWNKVNVSLFTTCHKLWSEKIIDVPYPLDGYGNFVSPIASVNRYMYWHVGSYAKSWYILCFDTIDEVFRRYKFPTRIAGSSSLEFAGYKESIVMFAHKLADQSGFCSSFDVYQLRNDTNQSWDRIMTCEPSVNFTRAVRFFKKDNADFVVLTTVAQYYYSPTNNYTGSLLYDPKTKKTIEFSLEDRKLKLYGYNASFASLR